MALIEQCNLFGKEWKFSSFVHWLNQSDKDFREEFLLSVFNHYGPRSVEFLFVLQGMVYWCIKKYNVVSIVDDISDIVHSCVVKVLESIGRFDVKKGKLSSYLHTICRGVVTCYNSKQKTLQKKIPGCYFAVRGSGSGEAGEQEERGEGGEEGEGGGGIDGGDVVEGVLLRELERRITLYRQVFGMGEEEGYRVALWDFFVEYREQGLDGVNWIDVVLFVLSREMKIPFIILKYIKNKYGENVLFLFYLFAGRKLRFPSLTKLYRIVEVAQKLTEGSNSLDLVRGSEALTEVLKSSKKRK